MDRPQLTQPYVNRRQGPSNFDLLDHLKATAWTCATINSSACARFPPKLYVTTTKSQARPKCATQTISKSLTPYLRDRLQTKLATDIVEVTQHPILTLFDTVNPYMNSFDLWEVTTLYQECIGSTYWYLETNALGRPYQIWPLPSQLVFMRPADNGFTYYFQGAAYSEQQIIHFRYPDPYYPYGPGLSPLRAAYNEARMATSYAELKLAKFDNRAAPDVIISPSEAIGEEERQRLELQWNNKFLRGGNGRALVAESGLSVEILNSQMGDLAALAEKGKNSEDICNAFHVPLSMLSTNTNLANLQASETQHSRVCLLPRLTRRDEKLNEQLVPQFDPSGRLKLCSDNPEAEDNEYNWRMADTAAKYGIWTINELREQDGLSPVPWGDKPCQPQPTAPSASPSPTPPPK